METTSESTNRSTNFLSEKYWTVRELASSWHVSPDAIRKLFRNEPGVLALGERSPKDKRPYLTLRIPESVALRVYTRLSSVGDRKVDLFVKTI
jgi:hypothetical protein